MRQNILARLLGGISALFLASACDDTSMSPQIDIEPPEEHRVIGTLDGGVRVMTRNVYVGADVDRILAAGSPEEIPLLAAEEFQNLLATDFRVRARQFAREIAWTRPHLIGLQEISTIRRQSPGDAAIGGTTPAEDVVFDYLDILMETLAARRLKYRVAAIIQNFDVEIPMLAGTDPLAFDDVRLTDFDVLLARVDVQTSDPLALNYQAKLSVPIGGGPVIEIPRGVVVVTATVNGHRYRVANSHLEPLTVPELLPLQMAQAQELLGILAGGELPVILMGDLNSPAPLGETYQFITGNGYDDAWLNRRGRPNEGFTCCHALDLLNPVPNFDHRIDLVLYKQFTPRRVRATVIGDEFINRTENGAWPSDHGGLVAYMRR